MSIFDEPLMEFSAEGERCYRGYCEASFDAHREVKLLGAELPSVHKKRFVRAPRELECGCAALDLSILNEEMVREWQAEGAEEFAHDIFMKVQTKMVEALIAHEMNVARKLVQIIPREKLFEMLARATMNVLKQAKHPNGLDYLAFDYLTCFHEVAGEFLKKEGEQNDGE